MLLKMADKFLILVIYLAVGLLLAILPALSPNLVRPSPLRFTTPSLPWNIELTRSTSVLVLICACYFLWTRSGGAFALTAVVITLLLNLMRRQGAWDSINLLAQTLVGFCALSTLYWWVGGTQFNWSFVAYGAAMLVLLANFPTQSLSPPANGAWGEAKDRWLLVFYGLACCLWLLNSAGFADPVVLSSTWHHWGAYIGPAQLLAAGARPFYDMPLQYGLGPTLVSLAAFQLGGAFGFYIAVAILNLAQALLCGCLVAYFTKRAGWGLWARVFALMGCFLCALVWTSWPPHVFPSIAGPSTGGMRFLPATALAAYVVFKLDSGSPRAALLPAHLGWLASLVWSPEAAFQSTCVWGTAYMVLIARSAPHAKLMAAFAAVARLVVIAVVWLIALVLVYRFFYGVFPTVYGFLAYVINPPGPLPINPFGSILGFLAIFSVAIYPLLLGTRSDIMDRPSFQLFVCLMLAYGTLAYFLGRSHDNNISNLAPFMLLILAATAPLAAHGATRPMFNVLLSGLLAGASLFGFQRWFQAGSDKQLFALEPAQVVENFSFLRWAREPSRADLDRAATAHPLAAAIINAKYVYNEPYILLDERFLIDLEGGKIGVWCAINSPVNYTFIPSSRRREFLFNGMQSIGRNGWLIVDRRLGDPSWIADFDAVYQRLEERAFGEYDAIRYAPRRS